ncbi:MAG: hypothetical protein C4548_13140 [Desulfobacteraceae bacterium]|jgi:predicted  nucleic acid-binding Zn-ribbon protein|nr:MAG: hypothetical protein C4548_13140 [Desulfobacteraceae bacterium]
MVNHLNTPIYFYLTGISFVTILVIVLCLSVYYYIKAKDIAPFLLRLEDLQRKIAEAQTTLEETKRELRDKQNEIAKADRLIAEGKIAEQWLANNSSQIAVLRIEIDKQKARLQEATENYQKRQEELNELTQRVSDKHVEINAATEIKNTLDIEVSKLTADLNSIKDLIAQKTKQENELTDSITKLQSAKNQWEAKVRDLINQAKLLEKQLEENTSNLDQIKDELGKTKKILATTEGQALAAEKTLAQLAKTQEIDKDRWKDLDRKFIQKSQPLNASNLVENDWLEEFMGSLRQHGFIFNERAILSFHTGLKCAKISPLVVLAGISGTGKSLLPELYAAALGMHFLPVAVQPRWDSPQDLFGFYNYMEGRYKATELSRLLWQFDKYNNQNAKQLYQKRMPMNLVLLDEMNLARVEYYFSDLLSKLEIRHGLDPENDMSRIKAEIEIECNASAQDKQTRRLFVALNTLFIGTMNEDESTQTLSDKVIDRSNVIRFGRPKRLAVTPSKERFFEKWTHIEGITFQNWTDWCKPNQDLRIREELNKTLWEINGILAGVHRPFGHRVNQAIIQYVACYPGDYNKALADQIEMKILPKLNGLDSQVNGFDIAMTAIEGIIGGLDDSELHEAFKESREKAADSFFKWRGVMR